MELVKIISQLSRKSHLVDKVLPQVLHFVHEIFGFAELMF